VQDAFRVRGGQGGEDAEADPRRPAGRERPFLLEEVAQ
jgi:hypothetical protein